MERCESIRIMLTKPKGGGSFVPLTVNSTITKNLNENTLIEDELGKPMKAMDVFSMSIHFLKTHLLERLKNEIMDTKEDDIHFVITVPAIWDDKSKLFMRMAAEKAGIKAQLLSIALEPEAASVFCQTMPFGVDDVGQSALKNPGAQYMVVDLGGGTADITVHELIASGESMGKLKELCPASGGPWGGKTVEESFLKFFEGLIGKKVLQKFREEEMEDYIDLMRDFEQLKKKFTPGSGSISIRIPVALNDTITKYTNYRAFDDLLQSNCSMKDIIFGKGKLSIPSKEFAMFYNHTKQDIIAHVRKLFREPKLRQVDKILMVGGFSECTLIQHAFKQSFPEKTVIAPHENGMIVLKGAVFTGFITEPISVRVSRYTYGIQTWPEFDPKVHAENKRTNIKDVSRYKDVFFKYVTKGEELRPGYTKSQFFEILKPDQDIIECTAYVSKEDNPLYVDSPGCRPILKLSIPLKEISVSNRTSMVVEESLIFGNSELFCCAKEPSSNKEFKVKCGFHEH